MKRLAETFDPHEHLNPMRASEGWTKAIARWEDLGIDPQGMGMFLMGGGFLRVAYEEGLRTAHEREAHKQIASIPRGAGALVRFLQRERATFGDLGEQLETALHRYRGASAAHEQRLRLPRHRPGEPWLTALVRGLVPHLRTFGLSWSRVVGLIYDGLVVAGHGDVATLEKVRHMVRLERRRTPAFGASTQGSLGPLASASRIWFVQQLSREDFDGVPVTPLEVVSFSSPMAARLRRQLEPQQPRPT